MAGLVRGAGWVRAEPGVSVAGRTRIATTITRLRGSGGAGSPAGRPALPILIQVPVKLCQAAEGTRAGASVLTAQDRGGGA